ncbi:MAG: nucleotide-binding protein [Saprospiraceae bacterium]|nr:nucleotide-binding protein [Saprospiraceae bacterium]
MKTLPKIFIASSSESREVATEIRNQLNEYADVNCWFDAGVFKHGRTTITDLIRVAKGYDMGVFVFNNDDMGVIRNKVIQFTRDNVLFEYGLFVANVGTERAFLFHPKNVPNFHLPSDLQGLVNIPFDSERELEFALRLGIQAIRDAIDIWKEEKAKKELRSLIDFTKQKNQY